MVVSVKNVEFKEVSKGRFETKDGDVIDYCNLVQKGDLVDPKWSLNPELAQDLEGVPEGTKLDLTVDGVKRTYSKGDNYFIPKGIKHGAKIYAGYADITFFNQKDRYKAKSGD